MTTFPTCSTSTVLRRVAVAGVAGVLALGLTACGDDTDTAEVPSTVPAQTTGAVTAGESSDQGLSLADGYVGAKTADKEMTAVFGVLTNTTDKDIHLTKVTGDLDGVYQYHEVTNGVMKQTEDGLTVPAGGAVDMEPGGHHIMIMENHDEIAAGDELTLTLTAEDGTSYDIGGIPVRVQQSGHEDYGTGDADGAGMTDTDMGDMHGADHADATGSH